MAEEDETPKENEDLVALGGAELLSAKMELSTAKHDLGVKRKENTELLKKTETLKQELEQQKADAKDIYFFLHKKLDDNYGEIDKLEKIKVELTDELEQKTAEFSSELERTNADWQRQVDELKEQIQDQEEELFSLKDYKENKEKIEATMVLLEQHLKEEKEGRQNDIDQLERKMFHEKERIKKEFLIKIKETKQNLLSMTEDQLHTTTKRTIMENEQMTAELQYQSRETERLLQMNTQLRAQNKKLKQSVELTEEAGREYAKKTHFYQKLIKKLHEKIQNQDEYGEESLRKGTRGDLRRKNRTGIDSENGSMLAPTIGRSQSKRRQTSMADERIVKDLRSKVASLEMDLNQVCSELGATRRQLERVSMGRQQSLSSADSKYADETPTYQNLLDFLVVSLKDAKANAIEEPGAKDMNLTIENDDGSVTTAPAAVFPCSLRVRMISQILDRLSNIQQKSKSQGEGSALEDKDSGLAEEFSQLFASGEEGASTGVGDWAAALSKPEVASIAVQTDNVDPITVLRSVDVGPRNGLRSFFTDSAGSMDSDIDGDNSVNKSESDTSRFLRGPVRGWGAPSSVYGMPRVNGPKTFRKRRTGLGATGRSVMAATH